MRATNGAMRETEIQHLGYDGAHLWCKTLRHRKGRWELKSNAPYALKHLSLQEATRGYLGPPPMHATY